MSVFVKSVKELDVRLVAEYNVAITEFTRRQATHNRVIYDNTYMTNLSAQYCRQSQQSV